MFRLARSLSLHISLTLKHVWTCFNFIRWVYCTHIKREWNTYESMSVHHVIVVVLCFHGIASSFHWRLQMGNKIKLTDCYGIHSLSTNSFEFFYIIMNYKANQSISLSEKSITNEDSFIFLLFFCKNSFERLINNFVRTYIVALSDRCCYIWTLNAEHWTDIDHLLLSLL